MSALLSFLGGNAFRMVWGEASAYLSKRQDHKYELERLARQAEVEAQVHERNMTALEVQHRIGIEKIYVQQAADTAAGELDAWVEVVKSTTRQTGVAWVDAWNASIRPGVATIAIGMMVAEIVALGFVLNDWHINVFSAAIGIFLADRTLIKRGK